MNGAELLPGRHKHVRRALSKDFDKMGGFRSGRRRGYERKRQVEWSFVLALVHLDGASRLIPEARGSMVLRAQAAAWTLTVEYHVRLEPTGLVATICRPLGNGFVTEHLRIDLVPRGTRSPRLYFTCPDPSCGRSASKLYLPLVGGDRFKCRHCHQLVYRSSQERGHTIAQLRRWVRYPTIAGVRRPSAPTPAR